MENFSKGLMCLSTCDNYTQVEILTGNRLQAAFPLAIFFARVYIFPLSASLITSYTSASQVPTKQKKVASREKIASGKPALIA